MVDPAALDKAAEAYDIAEYGDGSRYAVDNDATKEILRGYMRAAIEAYEAAKPKAGWRLVPVEPTLDMLVAADFAPRCPGILNEEDTKACWEAMLAAAPEPTP